MPPFEISHNSFEQPEQSDMQKPQHDAPQAFAAVNAEPTSLTPSAVSALEHHYEPSEAVSPALERLTETAVGPITIVRHDSNLPYDATDLIMLLATYQEAQIVYPPNPKFAIPPGRPDVIIRRNSDTRLLLHPQPRIRHPGQDGPLPTADAIAAHLQQYERLLAELKEQGLPMIARITCIVEQDPHNSYQPTIYTATKRLDSNNSLKRHHPQYGTLSAHHCGILASHVADTPLGDPIAIDLADPAQYTSPDGLLFDYDGYVTDDLDERLQDLHSLKRWAGDALPPSAEKTDIIDRINTAIDDIYQSP